MAIILNYPDSKQFSVSEKDVFTLFYFDDFVKMRSKRTDEKMGQSEKPVADRTRIKTLVVCQSILECMVIYHCLLDHLLLLTLSYIL